MTFLSTLHLLGPSPTFHQTEVSTSSESVKPAPLLGPFLPKHSRHTPDNAADASRALPERPALLDQVYQLMEHQQDSMVRLGRRHLEEAAALRQSEQTALLAGDAAVASQVTLVGHDDHRDGRWLPTAADLLQLLQRHVKAAAVADVVDQNHPVGPLQLLVAHTAALLSHLCELRVPDVEADFLTIDCINSTVNRF